MFVCTICQVEQVSATAMNVHLNGKIHKKYLRKSPESIREHKRLQHLVTNALRRPIPPSYQTIITNNPVPGTSNCRNIAGSTKGETFGVFVKGFPIGTDPKMLHQYFSQYGNVVKVKMGKHNNHAIVEFDQESYASKVTQKPCFFMGARLLVQLHSIKKNLMGLQESQNEAKIIEKLEHVKTFDEQVTLLQSLLQPDFQQVSKKYNQLCMDLHHIFSRTFPGSQIYPFGSTTTGLGFTTSDVDIYVSNVRQANDHGKNSDKSYLYKARAALQKSEWFVNVVAICHAKVPIVRCHHRYLDLNCDITFMSMLGVCNSKLIGFYLSLDWKLKPLMILLKFWAKTFSLTGQSHLIKNYALTMMFIFFLQQEPYCFPSVHHLQSDPNDPNSLNIQAGWNTGFSYVNFDITPLRNASLLQLFKGFLSFYATFDYASCIVCPYLGKILQRDDFKDGVAPEEYSFYKKNILHQDPLPIDRAMCVQDPFEHTRNITLITKNILDEFVSVCVSSLKLIEQATSEEGLLHNLLTSKCNEVESGFQARFTMAMPKDLKYLAKGITSSDPKERAKLWFETLKEFTLEVLKDVLKCEVTEDPIDSKSAEQDTEQTKFTLSCTATHPTLWSAKPRKKLAVKDSTQTILAKQKEISDAVMQKIDTKSQFSFQLVLRKTENPAKVVLQFENFEACKSQFRPCAIFFICHFPSWFRTHLDELNKLTTSQQQNQ